MKLRWRINLSNDDSRTFRIDDTTNGLVATVHEAVAVAIFPPEGLATVKKKTAQMADSQLLMKRPVAGPATVAAVIAPCSSRKRLESPPQARAVSLAISSQATLETAWLARVKTFERVVAAQDLYGGRGAALARRAAHKASASLYIVSAGLGLVAGSERVPAYGMTVARRGDDSIPMRVTGRFDPSAWWSAVCSGAVSTTLERVLTQSQGRITLLALTKPYAAMVSASLAVLPGELTTGLRIFGWRLRDDLPASLHRSVMNYDARLEATLPGTRNDFAQRAMAHFVDVVLPIGGEDSEVHRRQIEVSLAGLVAPERIVRPRASDDEILDWLGQATQAEDRVGRLLRRIRDQGIACEQSRFARLHAQSRQRVKEGMASQ
jgi:hypothetical protein